MGPHNQSLSIPLPRACAARIELPHGFRVAQGKLGELGIGADLFEDLPRPRAFLALGGLERDGDALDIVEAESMRRPLSRQKLSTARNGDLGKIDAVKRRAQPRIGDMNLG